MALLLRLGLLRTRLIHLTTTTLTLKDNTTAERVDSWTKACAEDTIEVRVMGRGETLAV